jgi:hypothetical protein
MVRENHRVRTMPPRTADLRDDLDVLEAVGHEAEARCAFTCSFDRFVARDGAVDAAEKEVEQVVAVDIDGVRNVLPVCKDRPAVGIGTVMA